MAKESTSECAYGEVAGITVQGVPAYSNGSDMYFSGQRHFEGPISTGFKWQCVEFARRWLLKRKGVLLPEVPWACMIFKIKEFELVSDGSKVPAESVKNGGNQKPEPGLLIWPSAEDNIVGHIAAITEVGDDWVRIADQNQTFHKWQGQFSEQLPMKVEVDKNDATKKTYTIVDSDGDLPLGWVLHPSVPDRQNVDEPLVFHEKYKRPEDEAMYLKRHTFIPKDAKENWLDLTNPAEKKFVDTFGMDVSRSRLDEAEVNYYSCNMELMLRCVSSGQDLHQMFLAATDRVINDDVMLERFGIDKQFWPRLKDSWATQKDCITGRFDFAFKDNQLKCFEYNADSASTLLECGVIQGKYAESVGIAEGSRSSGFRIESLLKHAWKEAGCSGGDKKIHFLIDDDDEEEYTALYVASGAQANGCKTKICKMFDEFSWKDGKIVDKDGAQITTLWKTWMWESAITDFYAAQKERGDNWKPKDGDAVRLCDLMLGDDSNQKIRVFEPMWKLIPSNKAILPLLSEMFPEHPAILKSSWEVTPDLKAGGYVRKPIVGRVGRNITVCDGSGETLKASEGNFGDREMIYQELFELPKRDDYYAILGGWILGNGFYAGTGIREDKTIITGVESPYSALRIVLPKDSSAPERVTHESLAKEETEGAEKKKE